MSPSSQTDLPVETTGGAPVKKQYYGRTAKVGAVWSVLRQAGIEVIYLPTSMLLARLLEPADFGIAAASSFFIVLSTRLTQLGFNSALVKLKDLRPEHADSVFIVNLGLGALTWLILFAAAPLAAHLFDSAEAVRALRASSFIFLITPFGTVPFAMIAREMQFKRSTVAHWVDAISGVAVSIGLAVSGYGYWSIILGHLTGTLCQVAVVTWLSRWRPTFRFSMAALRDLLGFGLGVHMKRLLQFACFNIDTLIVGSVLGMTALGFYDKAFTLMNRLLGRLALGGGNFRIFAIIHEDRVRYRRAYLRMTLAISLIALPGFGALMVMAPAVIVVLFGKSWLPSVVPFQILCVAGVIRLYDGYASAANEVMGVIWLQVRRQAVGVVLVAVFTWLGSRYGGVVGAAIGITAALALLTASMQALVIRETGITAGEMLRAQLPAAVCALGIMVVALCTEILIRRWVHEPAAWTMLLGQAGTGCIFYAWFILRSPFASVRGLVHETIADLGLETRLLTALVAR